MKQAKILRNEKQRVSPIFFAFLLFFSYISLGILTINNESVIYENMNQNNTVNVEKPKASPNIFGRIHIIGTNWSLTNETYSWCSGAGTMMDPFVIEDLVIDANGADAGLFVENSAGIYFRIENCTVFDSSQVLSFSAGIRFYNADNGTITNCTLYNNKDGILLRNFSDSNTISNCTIWNNTQNGVNIDTSKSNMIKLCNIYNNTHNGIYLFDSQTTGTVIKNNTIFNNFCPDMYDANINLYYSDFNSIYNNTILDSHNYGIYGTDCDHTWLADNFINNSLNEGILIVECDNQTLINNTAFYNGKNTFRFYNIQGIWMENNTIEETRPTGPYFSGLVLDHVYNGTFFNNTIGNSNNGLTSTYSQDLYLSNMTIHDLVSMAVYFGYGENISIVDSNFPSTGSGIIMMATKNATIMNCSGIGSKVPGNIGVQAGNNCDNATIVGNNFSNFYNGLLLTSSKNLTIQYNQLTNNVRGIYSDTNLNWSVIKNNNITQNDDYGVYFIENNWNIVQYNTINQNDYGVRLEDSFNNIVSNNTIKANSIQNIYETPAGGNTIQYNNLADVIAQITVNYTSIVVGMYVDFDGTSSVGDSPLTYFWNFNDTTTSDQANPIHHFNTVGTYNVTLIVTDRDNEYDTALIVIYVNEDTNPTVTIGSNTTKFYLNHYINFSFSYFGGNLPYQSYNWSVNGAQMGSDADFIFYLTSLGTVTLTLTVLDFDGDSAQDELIFTVIQHFVPTAAFTTDTVMARALINQLVTFTDESAPGDVSDPIVSYEWDFGDESTHIYTQNVDHFFTETGSFTVVLNVTDSNGDWDIETFNIIIEIDANPNAEFDVSDGPYYIDKEIDFMRSVPTVGNIPLDHQWDFGDGTPNSTSLDAFHTYAEPGTYTIIHTITDRDGDVSVFSIEITVEDPATTDDDESTEDSLWENIANSPNFLYYAGGIVLVFVIIGLIQAFRSSKGSSNKYSGPKANKREGNNLPDLDSKDVEWKF